MRYSIQKTGSEPAYFQLYKQIRTEIVAGRLVPGTKLMSKRLLCEELGISVITVEHAYSLLSEEGYITPVQRSGYYVSFGAAMNPGSHISESSHKPASLQSVPYEFPFSSYSKIMRRVLSDYDASILMRCHNQGCPELRGAIASYLGRSRGILVQPNQIIIGSGAEYLYGLVVQLLGRQSTYALEDPSYEKIRKVYEANGAFCTFLKLGHDGIISSELEACRARVLHVTPYNSYPSGVTASAAKRHEYAAWAEIGNSYIIEDDYDSEFSSSLKQINTIYSLSPNHVIYMNTFSKTIAPSMRMGYMILPDRLLTEYQERLNFYSCTVPLYEQLVLAEFLDSGLFERHINRCRRKWRRI